ncbi:MAG: chemotaxis protein CheW [Gammaproteobacteria bacterium]|nr:chemotaxis protein CheW [Gammaproteobacteria bacterium]MBT7306883.1 chemotaxis protein CheW [Gammaproteobacteria bacterium]
MSSDASSDPSLFSAAPNLSNAQLDEWANFYAQEKGEADNIWASAEWLHFLLAGEQFILPMSALDEVSTVTLGVRLPHLPAAAIGLINLRGETILTIDLGQMLNLRGSVAPNEKQRVLLFKESDEEDQQRTAFLIDEILTVTDIDEAQLQLLHEGDESEKSRYIDAVTDSHSGDSISRIHVGTLLRGVREML